MMKIAGNVPRVDEATNESTIYWRTCATSATSIHNLNADTAVVPSSAGEVFENI